MHVHTAQPASWISYAITGAVVALVLFFRLRSVGKTRPLKLERLWILPTIYLVFAGMMFWSFPPTGLAWLYCVAALVVGAGLGWQRGRMMRIAVDPESHALNQVQSPAALLFILALVAARSGARSLLGSGDNVLHLSAFAITDILIALALGLLTAQRVEMFLRARRLLDEARMARAA